MFTRRFIMAAIPLLVSGCAATAIDDGTFRETREWTPEEYRLGAGDRVRVTVFNEPSLTGEFQVGATGLIAMPLIGEVPATGQTVAEVQQDVETRLRDGYLLDPRVSVEVLTYRPFYILGEVRNPGTYPYSAGLTVTNAVATAGGFTYRANTRRVFIRHANSSREIEYRFADETRIAPGDTIRIGERIF